MRLDWFVPMLRKPSPRVPARQPNPLTRLARQLLPAALFSDPVTKRRGWFRRGLRWLGLSWLSSPVRRLSQTVCFLTFLALFFYVAWPYSARPANISRNWLPVEVDATSGQVKVSTEDASSQAIRSGQLVYVIDDAAAGNDNRSLGAFQVAAVGERELMLLPKEPLDAKQLEELSLSFGPWSLHADPPGKWPSHYADDFQRKERIAAETFLIIDPLVSISTALASRSWVWSLVWAGVILAVCVLIPRGFCGYLCPLGTLIDLFDGTIGKRVTRFRVAEDGWWVHIKYYVLLGTLVAAACGVLVSGFVSAIPVITRGMLFLFGPLQTGWTRGWHQMPPLGWGHWLSIALFFAVLALGLLRPRFWCKYVCPSGAVFSLGNLFRVSERKVESSCIHCNKCVEVCPFDAIKLDFTTRTSDCTLCQTCGGVCPTHAIKFVERWNGVELKVLNDPPTCETPLGRRGFIAATVGIVSGTVGGLGLAAATHATAAPLAGPGAVLPVRPPGSVPEAEFLEMCIRCGECFKACPNDVLQASGFQQGLVGLWTPRVEADWAGCESSCNACGQVCPTGAIRALPLYEKRVCRMGLAIVNEQTCLPYAGREACQLCVDECVSAGYHAIEFTRVGTLVDAAGAPVEDSGYVAPVVRADKCVGCGLCQTRCYGINVLEKRLLDVSAIVIEAGSGKEDRLMGGSYLALRQAEAQRAAADGQPSSPAKADYLPEFLK